MGEKYDLKLYDQTLLISRSRDPKLNLPEDHLVAIEKHLRNRASRLIGLAKGKE